MPGPVTEEVFSTKADLLIERVGQLRDHVGALETTALEVSALIEMNQNREEALLARPRQRRSRQRSHGAL